MMKPRFSRFVVAALILVSCKDDEDRVATVPGVPAPFGGGCPTILVSLGGLDADGGAEGRSVSFDNPCWDGVDLPEGTEPTLVLTPAPQDAGMPFTVHMTHPQIRVSLTETATESGIFEAEYKYRLVSDTEETARSGRIWVHFGPVKAAMLHLRRGSATGPVIGIGPGSSGACDFLGSDCRVMSSGGPAEFTVKGAQPWALSEGCSARIAPGVEADETKVIFDGSRSADCTLEASTTVGLTVHGTASLEAVIEIDGQPSTVILDSSKLSFVIPGGASFLARAQVGAGQPAAWSCDAPGEIELAPPPDLEIRADALRVPVACTLTVDAPPKTLNVRLVGDQGNVQADNGHFCGMDEVNCTWTFGAYEGDPIVNAYPGDGHVAEFSEDCSEVELNKAHAHIPASGTGTCVVTFVPLAVFTLVAMDGAGNAIPDGVSRTREIEEGRPSAYLTFLETSGWDDGSAFTLVLFDDNNIEMPGLTSSTLPLGWDFIEVARAIPLTARIRVTAGGRTVLSSGFRTVQ